MSSRTKSRNNIIYEVPSKPVEHIYEEIADDEHLYADIPSLNEHIYEEIGYPVAEYSLASAVQEKVAKKPRRTSQQVKLDEEEKQKNKKHAAEIKFWKDELKKREREEIAKAKVVADEEREKKHELEAEKKKIAIELKKSLTQEIKNKEEILRKKKELREKKKADVAAKKATQLYEVSEDARKRMFLTGKSFDGKGFRAKEFTAKYIELYGNTNPFTGEPVEATYDVSAAIRSLMYECSPSSNQSWFRHGVGKKAEQVAPWLFYNKALAEFNNANEWKQWTETTSKGRERGTWFVLTEGSNARYDWQNEKYGPKPSGEQLAAAAIGRTLGWRK
jgi:hypothetical protein